MASSASTGETTTREGSATGSGGYWYQSTARGADGGLLQAVDTAVADMAYDRRDQLEVFDVLLRLCHAIGKARDRHADIGRHRPRTGADLRRRKISIMTRLPQLGAILRARGPLECTAAAI